MAPWPRDGIRLVYSVSKTFLAIAAAFAEAEGLLARNERLVDVFPEAAEAAGPRAARVTVEDCLRMSTGHHADTLDSFGRPRRGVGGRTSCAPSPRRSPARGSCTTTGPAGCWPWPCSGAPASGCVDYLRPRLLDPLGVRDARWTSWAGTDLGFSGLHVTTDTVARLGLLLLQDGVWQGRQVLPAGWVATASSALADTAHHPDPDDWRVGYGYQMWRSRHGFRADGAYGQFALVLPEHDLVVAVTACTETTHEVLDAVWEELLPHLAAAPLPADPGAHGALVAALDTAAAPASGSTAPAPPSGGPWSFAHTPTTEHPALRSVVVHPAEHGWVLDIDDGGRVERRLRRRSVAGCRGHALGGQRRLGGTWRVRGDGRRPRDPALPAAAVCRRRGDRSLARGAPARTGPGLATGTAG